MSWDVTLSAVCEEKISYEHMSC